MYAGGSGELYTTHVKFIVDPLSMYKSGAPIISVDGSAMQIKNSYDKMSKQNKIMLLGLGLYVFFYVVRFYIVVPRGNYILNVDKADLYVKIKHFSLNFYEKYKIQPLITKLLKSNFIIHKIYYFRSLDKDINGICLLYII